jgi:DinB superfamily
LRSGVAAESAPVGNVRAMSAEPVAPESDNKDWTWVLQRPCAECGFDSASVHFDEIAGRTRIAVATLEGRLAEGGAEERPAPQVWSPLEYACHVRDVCRVFGARLSVMRRGSNPTFVNWDQDDTALRDRYWQQDPRAVAGELADEGERIAADFESVSQDELPRSGRRSDGSQFTVESLARYFLHDLEHHVHDVTG